MPGSVIQRSIDIGPAAGVVYQDHESDSGSAKDIQGIKALFQKVDFAFKLSDY